MALVALKAPLGEGVKSCPRAGCGKSSCPLLSSLPGEPSEPIVRTQSRSLFRVCRSRLLWHQPKPSHSGCCSPSIRLRLTNSPASMSVLPHRAPQPSTRFMQPHCAPAANGNACALQGHNGLIGTGHFEGAIATVAQQLHDGRAYRNIGMEDQDRLNCGGFLRMDG